MTYARPKQAVVLFVSVLALAGCKTTQPDRVNAGVASLTIKGNASMLLENCYEIWQDGDGDGIPDTDTGFRQCFDAGPTQGPLPWRYSLSISVIHAGTTTEEIVTSTTGLVGSSVEPNDNIPDFLSLTDYSTYVIAAPPRDPAAGNFYVNGQQVTQGSQVWLNFLGLDFGPANILGATNSFDFNITSGDTIVVRLRKQAYAQAQPFIALDDSSEIKLSASLSVGGVEVATRGATETDRTDGAGITFSFTVQ